MYDRVFKPIFSNSSKPDMLARLARLEEKEEERKRAAAAAEEEEEAQPTRRALLRLEKPPRRISFSANVVSPLAERPAGAAKLKEQLDAERMQLAAEREAEREAERKEAEEQRIKLEAQVATLQQQLQVSQQQLEAEQASGICILCLERPKGVAFTPCGHVATCVTCCGELLAHHAAAHPNTHPPCPVCRTPIVETVGADGTGRLYL